MYCAIKRIWGSEIVKSGTLSITCKLYSLANNFSWYFTGVYGSNCRIERQELDLWLRKEAVTDTPREMLDFSEGIEDLEFVDPALFGGTFTWNKANNLGVASRFDRFLFD